MGSLFAALAALAPDRAYALPSYSAQDLSKFTDPLVQSLIETVALGTAHRAYQPASALGAVIGLDLGLEVTAISLPDTFVSALKTAGATTTVPPAIAIPRVNVHKGLPFGVDVGFSYIGYQGNKVVGGDIHWSILKKGILLPAVALRLSDTYSKLFFMNTHNVGADLIVSKKIAFLLEPYLGVGMQWVSGDLSVPVNTSIGLPVNISSSHSFNTQHIFVGMPIKMAFLHLTPEADHSFKGINTYGLKLSLGF